MHGMFPFCAAGRSPSNISANMIENLLLRQAEQRGSSSVHIKFALTAAACSAQSQISSNVDSRLTSALYLCMQEKGQP